VPQNECIHLLKALADDTRWRIVQTLLVTPRSVGELADDLKVSPYNASKHIKILRQAGIVTAEKEGKSVQCQVADEFRRTLSKKEAALDLGCCTFRFDS